MKASPVSAVRRAPPTFARTSSPVLRSPQPPVSRFRRLDSWKESRKSPRSAIGRPRRRAFVKPDTLGAKIGIFAGQPVPDPWRGGRPGEAHLDALSDRALIQPFVEGDDARVGFIDGAISRPARRGASSRSGERDPRRLFHREGQCDAVRRRTPRARAAGSADRRAAFVPRMQTSGPIPTSARARRFRASSKPLDEASAPARPSDCFSIDFRMDAAGRPVFLGLESVRRGSRISRTLFTPRAVTLASRWRRRCGSPSPGEPRWRRREPPGPPFHGFCNSVSVRSLMVACLKCGHECQSPWTRAGICA